MDQFLRQMLQNMDEEQAKQILQSVDEEQVRQGIQWIMEELVMPHMEEIRERARNDPATESIREQYENMPPDQRERMFYDTLDALVATLANCRESPKDGFEELKTMLRDPYTVEALLLIFENEDHIDEEYTETLKDFGVTHIRWIGVSVLPEMYEEHEIEEALNQMGLDPDAHEGAPGG